jgi:3-hydroxyisobutyrate dehydrogenase
MIAVLGTGLLGSGFVRAALRRGETVQVWNRTAARAEALAANGARVCATPAEAARGALRIHLVLSDDEAVEAVLAAAQPAAGTWIFDHSTTSTAGVKARSARLADYQTAPVFMGPKNAEESTGLMMLSGDRAKVQRAMPLLEPMTGKLLDLGGRVDAAMAFKLMGNLFLMALTAGCADMLALAKALGVPARDAATLFEHFNPGATVSTRMKRMIDAAYDKPSWELAMARKDARIMQDEADAAGVPFIALPAIVAQMEVMLARGHAHSDWTVIAEDYLGSGMNS